MQLDKMNEKVHQIPSFQSAIKTPAQAKEFFRLLWFEVGLDFNPDDDFEGYGVFDEEAVRMLNSRMDECFDILGTGIYDIAINIMGEEKH